jgi:hypothetical protein
MLTHDLSGLTSFDDWPQWIDDEFTGSDGEITQTAGEPQHGP